MKQFSNVDFHIWKTDHMEVEITIIWLKFIQVNVITTVMNPKY